MWGSTLRAVHKKVYCRFEILSSNQLKILPVFSVEGRFSALTSTKAGEAVFSSSGNNIFCIQYQTGVSQSAAFTGARGERDESPSKLHPSLMTPILKRVGFNTQSNLWASSTGGVVVVLMEDAGGCEASSSISLDKKAMVCLCKCRKIQEHPLI